MHADPPYPETAMAVLKARGYRQTKPRQLVLTTLDLAPGALSPYEIVERIREAGEKGDVASVYRILQTLEENGLVHRVITTGKYRKCLLGPESECHRHQMQHCHHNLVCRTCGRIEEVHCPGLDVIEQAIGSQSPFRIERHALEFSGLCEACQIA